MTDHKNDKKKHPVMDWSGPWLRLVVLLNLLVRDAVGSISIVALAHGVEFVITIISGPSWKWSAGNVEISPSDVIHYMDLVILVGFLATGLYEFWNWMREK